MARAKQAGAVAKPGKPSRAASGVPAATRSPLGKLNRPRLARSVPRERLETLLDAHADVPVTWVAGPPGAGKTTLVAAWLAGTDALWMLVDAGDSDFATFIHYLSLAAANGVRRGARLPVPTPEDLRDPPGFMRRWVRSLTAVGRGGPVTSARSALVLVLDNYQELAADSPVHAALAAATTEWPTDGRLIVISRVGPPAAWVRPVASRQVALIDAEALRFTLEETGRLVALHADARSPQALHAAADGWAAGLTLMLASREPAAPTTIADADRVTTRALLFDYFASEVVAGLPPDWQDALLRLSVLPDMTEGTADVHVGSAAGSAVLREMYRRNLFTARRGTGEPVYVFHALFRDFLGARAAEAFGAAGMRDLRRRGGDILATAGQIDDAMALHAAAGHWARVEALVVAHAASYIAQERSRALARWIEALPLDRHDGADVAYWLGVCRMTVDPLDARTRFERAYAGFEARGDDTGRLAAAAGAAECIAMQGAGLQALDRWITVFESLAPAYFAIRDATTELRVLPGMLAAFVGRQAHHRLANVLIDRAEALLESEPAARQRLLFGTVASCFVDTGQHERIERIVRRAGALRDATHIAPATVLQWRQVELYWKTLAGHLDGIAADAVAIEQLAAAPGLERGRGAAFTAAAQGLWLSFDFAGAWHHLALARAAIDPARTLDLGVLEFVCGATCIAERRFDDTRRHLRRAVDLARAAGSPGRERVALFMSAVAAAWSGALADADAALGAATAHPSYAASPFHQFVIAMIDAFVAERGGDVTRCTTSLRRGFGIARENGYDYAPGVFGTRIIVPLCAFALANDIESNFVRRLVRDRRIPPPADAPAQWPWPVAVRVLGGFRLERDGAPLPAPRKEQKKPLDLLRLVIALGGTGVHTKLLAQLLWPDAAGDAAQNSFDNALHRLRKLLGDERALVLADGALTLDPAVVWIDARELDTALAAVDGIARAGATAAAREALVDRILRLHRGPFLAGDESHPPIIAAREQLRARFMRQMLAVAATFEAESAWEQAATLHRRVLEQDVLAEEVYCRLIACCLRLGWRAEAWDTLRRCRENLSIILGIRPGPEIEALEAMLRAGAAPG